MKTSARRWRTTSAGFLALLLLSAGGAVALQAPERGGRFDALIVEDPQSSLDVATTPLASLPAKDGVRLGWDGFRATHGQEWRVHLDRRSGAPLLVAGRGIPWSVPPGASVESIATSLRPFIAGNRALLLADNAELVLDADASGPLTPEVWQVAFKRVVAGVPVAGERYLFTIGHGNLISFGTPRWSRIDANTIPDLDAAQAQAQLAAYMGLTVSDRVGIVETPALELIPLRAGGPSAGGGHGPFAGALGTGYASALVWRVTVRVAGEPGTWLALVDAHTGAIRSFVDDNKYARAKGGIYPISDDQVCPDGCEQPNFPMPFADVSVGGSTQTTSTMGIFSCTPGGSTATTQLVGPYVTVNDNCGPVSESVTCDADLDLQSSAGIDCDVPAGSSTGNTHAARSGFYHLNRIAEHARTWLPTRTWLTARLSDNVNIALTCNAYWNGATVNFYKSGGGCSNTGEIAAVFLHEWGHGLDENDGGGYDNPSEAYADVTAIMATHVSCIGRGFRPSANCGGNGDPCLSCTGVREQDWDKHASHTPATPAGFLANYCPGGGGPCGKEVHCEAHVGAEAMWDLAVRDLPAMGLDQATAWNLADKLWYKSRLGSGGNAYNCSLPFSDGCSVGSWFHKMLVVDDNDGNLANGTPHAAAIFAAFDRHEIACGAASDASNQNTTTCPALIAPILSTTAGSGSAALAWTAVPGTLGYRILRNDAGCQAAMTRISGLVTNTSYTDLGLANGSTAYYNVQPFVSNSACDGPLSNCQAVTPQPFAGSVGLDAGAYSCSSTITVTVVDSNIGSDTTSVSLASTTEPAAESVTLTRASPGSATYVGTIHTTSGAAAPNGSLSVAEGDAITATYVDASDGAGGANIVHSAGATGACAPGGVKPVADGSFGTAMTASRADAAGATIDVAWDVTTCSSPDHHLLYGDLAALASPTALGASCNLGTSGSATWSGVPAGDLWFLLVGDDGVSTEGSWGTDGAGAQRGLITASGQCGLTARDNSGVCP
jgi:hypothetical protein